MPDVPKCCRGRTAVTRWGRTVQTIVLLTTFGAALAGCGPRADSGADARRERAALVERAQGIRARLQADSTAYRALEPEWKRLVADVEAWQARTGRNDIRTGSDSVRTPGTGTAARDDDGGGGEGCESCPGYTVEPDRICFLTEEGSCPGPDDIVGRICVYQCLWIGAGAEPGRRGESGER